MGDLGVADVRRLDQPGLAGDAVLHVDRRAVVEQQLRHLGVPVVRRAVERAVAVAVRLVDVGARLDQLLHDVDVAVPRRQDERAVAVVVLEVDVDRVVAQQRDNLVVVALLDRAEQRQVRVGRRLRHLANDETLARGGEAGNS